MPGRSEWGILYCNIAYTASVDRLRTSRRQEKGSEKARPGKSSRTRLQPDDFTYLEKNAPTRIDFKKKKERKISFI